MHAVQATPAADAQEGETSTGAGPDRKRAKTESGTELAWARTFQALAGANSISERTTPMPGDSRSRTSADQRTRRGVQPSIMGPTGSAQQARENAEYSG